MFTVQQSKLLFKLRTRMLDVKANFKNMFHNDMTLLNCNLCDNNSIEDQKHVIECTEIENNKNISIDYFDLFSKNLDTMKNAIVKYEKSWKEMNTLKDKKTKEKDKV